MRRCRFLAGLALSLLLCALAAADETAVFHFDEGAGDVAADGSGKAHHAQLHNAQWVEGKRGKAVAFCDKKSWVGIDWREDLALASGPFTVACWFKPVEFSWKGTYELLGKGGDVGPGWRLYITWNAVVFRSGDGRGKQGGAHWQVHTQSATDEIFVNQWNHVAVTRDADGIVRLYLNGRECDRSGEPFKITRQRREVCVGSYASGYAYPFNGVIDEVVIRDDAMSALEVFREAHLSE